MRPEHGAMHSQNRMHLFISVALGHWHMPRLHLFSMMAKYLKSALKYMNDINQTILIINGKPGSDPCLTETLNILLTDILFAGKIASFAWDHWLQHMICYHWYHHLGCFGPWKFFRLINWSYFHGHIVGLHFQLRIICIYVLNFPSHFPCAVDAGNYLFPLSSAARFGKTFLSQSHHCHHY